MSAVNNDNKTNGGTIQSFQFQVKLFIAKWKLFLLTRYKSAAMSKIHLHESYSTRI
jgi:hypothetical protein